MTGTCTCDGTSPLCDYCLAERQRIVTERLAAAACKCPHPRCRCEHVIAWCESGVIACEFTNAAPPRPLAVQLNRLYPRVADEPRRWPKPTILNEPLTPRRPPT